MPACFGRTWCADVFLSRSPKIRREGLSRPRSIHSASLHWTLAVGKRGVPATSLGRPEAGLSAGGGAPKEQGRCAGRVSGAPGGGASGDSGLLGGKGKAGVPVVLEKGPLCTQGAPEALCRGRALGNHGPQPAGGSLGLALPMPCPCPAQPSSHSVTDEGGVHMFSEFD